jgi:hypothetical protein
MMTEYFIQSEIAVRRRDMLAAATESRLRRLARAARHRRGVVQT